MAVRFHPLPPEAFNEEARPHIARLNLELRELFGLQGTIEQPITSQRSDGSISRRATEQVHVTRITPSIMEVVSGSSTVVGTPALTLGTVNTVGSTTTAVSINSAIALFGTALPLGLSASAIVGTSAFAARADHIHAGLGTSLPVALAATAAVGTSAFAARADHRHTFPTSLQSTANLATLALTDDGTDETLVGSLGNLRIAPAGSGDIILNNTAGMVRIGGAYHLDTAALFVRPNTIVDGGASLFFQTGATANNQNVYAVNGLMENDSRTGVNFVTVRNDLRTIGAGVTCASLYGIQQVVSLNGNATTIVTDSATVKTSAPTRTAGTEVLTNWFSVDHDAAPSWVTNSWTVRGMDKAEFRSQASRAETVLLLRQLATGTASGAHINFDSKAGDATTPTAGDLWRNATKMKFYEGTLTHDLNPLTTQGDLLYHNGTTEVRLAKGTAGQKLRMNTGATAPEWDVDDYTKDITIESPTATEDITMFYTPVAITVSEVRVVHVGTTPSLTLQVFHATDRSAAGTGVTTSAAHTNTTTGSMATLNDATIPAASYVWIETTAQSGTITNTAIHLRYTVD